MGAKPGKILVEKIFFENRKLKKIEKYFCRKLKNLIKIIKINRKIIIKILIIVKINIENNKITKNKK